MPRPTKFNQERAAKIIELVRKGNFKNTAARAAGVNISTLNRWIADGKAGEGKKLRAFCAALEEADAQAEIDGVAKWVKHQDNSPEAIKEYLRRRFPHWNVPDKQQTEHSGEIKTTSLESRVESLKEFIKSEVGDDRKKQEELIGTILKYAKSKNGN